MSHIPHFYGLKVVSWRRLQLAELSARPKMDHLHKISCEFARNHFKTVSLVLFNVVQCGIVLQCHLDKEGASDLVVDLIVNNHSSRIFMETVELGIALLEGGNSTIQVRINIGLNSCVKMPRLVQLMSGSMREVEIKTQFESKRIEPVACFVCSDYNPEIGISIPLRETTHKHCSVASFSGMCERIPSFQKSFFARLTTDKSSEKFFKVFYERMREAQAEIKATVSVNTGDGLGGGKTDEKDANNRDDTKKKREPKSCVNARRRIVFESFFASASAHGITPILFGSETERVGVGRRGARAAGRGGAEHGPRHRVGAPRTRRRRRGRRRGAGRGRWEIRRRAARRGSRQN